MRAFGPVEAARYVLLLRVMSIFSRRREFVLHGLAAVGGGLAFGTSCLSPTLPLPPPEAPDSIELNLETNLWHVRGRCTPGAVVLVKNGATGRIVGTEDTDANGRYFIAIEAEECDFAEVWQIIGSEASTAVGFYVTITTTAAGPDQSCQQGDTP